MNYEQLLNDIDTEIETLTSIKESVQSLINTPGRVPDSGEVVRGHLTPTGTSQSKPGTRKRGSTKGRTMPVYTDAQRLEAVRLVRGGLSIGKAAKQIGATFFTVRSWVRSGRWEPQTATKKAPAKKKSVAKKSVKKASKKTSVKKTSGKRTKMTDKSFRKRAAEENNGILSVGGLINE